MPSGVENRIVKLRNELNAQKQASPLSWGQLALPENTPSVTINESLDITAPLDGANIAKFIATFTRTDGQSGAPLVDFAYDYKTSPTGIEIYRQHGATITATSEESLYQGDGSNIVDISDNSVSFEILIWQTDYLGTTSNFYYDYGVKAVDLELTVNAISPVPGTLTVERSYDA